MSRRRRYPMRERRRASRDSEPASTVALICAVLGLFLLWPLVIVAMILAAPHRRHNGNAAAAWTVSMIGLALCFVCVAVLVALAVWKGGVGWR